MNSPNAGGRGLARLFDGLLAGNKSATEVLVFGRRPSAIVYHFKFADISVCIGREAVTPIARA